MIVAALLVAATLQFGDIAVVEYGSPGLVPSMKFNYVNLYARDRRFRETAVSYPKLEVVPTAATFAGDAMLIAEVRAETTLTTIVRHTADGAAIPLGSPFSDRVTAMAVGAGGDLFVATTGGFLRMDPLTGDARARFSLSAPVMPPIVDFDFDIDGCNAVFTTPNEIFAANLCAPEFHPRPFSIGGPARNTFGGVRYLPNGEILLASGADILRLDRSGRIRLSVPGAAYPCRFAVEPDPAGAAVLCGINLLRLDLTTNALSAPLQIANGSAAYTIAIRNEWRAAGPRPRRRVVGH